MSIGNSFGVYIHIPYCLQRCTYCDFATYEKSQIMPPESYVSLLIEEMHQKISSANSIYKDRKVDSIYFGGGTPSLLPAELIVSILIELEKHGLHKGPNAEVTIEINPATINEKKMQTYIANGINRFSVGAQTFNDALLKSVHREHNAQQTRDTLALLASFGVNYSADLLFALPGQSIEILKSDLDQLLSASPKHISPYCLTVPEGHVLSSIRPAEEIQLEMFELIQTTLERNGYERYEISNFCKPGFHSRHNCIYWDDSEYLGLGLSAHSYAKNNTWGVRYWNASSIGKYEEQIKNNIGRQYLLPWSTAPDNQQELLKIHQSLTDFCHIFLRTKYGLNIHYLKKKFGEKICTLVENILTELASRDWVRREDCSWLLTNEGVVLSNQVFASLTFLEGELEP